MLLSNILYNQEKLIGRCDGYMQHPPSWLNSYWIGTHMLDYFCNCSITGFVEKALVRDLLTECSKMYEFNHPNVLKLSGVCLDGGPAPYIIMPYMENGSLNTYLKNERENFLLDPETAQPDDVVWMLNILQLISHAHDA